MMIQSLSQIAFPQAEVNINTGAQYHTHKYKTPYVQYVYMVYV